MRVAQNLSILFWIRKNAGKLTDKKSPIYCRITINAKEQKSQQA